MNPESNQVDTGCPDCVQSSIRLRKFRASAVVPGQSRFHLAQRLSLQCFEAGFGFGTARFGLCNRSEIAIENRNLKRRAKAEFMMAFVKVVPRVELDIGPLLGDLQLQGSFIGGIFEQAGTNVGTMQQTCLLYVAEGLLARGSYPIVEVSYLELAEPTILAGGARCVERGATAVILLPYFLSPGVHVVEDLQVIRDDLARKFPVVQFRLAEPIGRHPLLVDVVEQRASEA